MAEKRKAEQRMRNRQESREVMNTHHTPNPAGACQQDAAGLKA
jgi:hypothetical protein